MLRLEISRPYTKEIFYLKQTKQAIMQLQWTEFITILRFVNKQQRPFLGFRLFSNSWEAVTISYTDIWS